VSLTGSSGNVNNYLVFEYKVSVQCCALVFFFSLRLLTPLNGTHTHTHTRTHTHTHARAHAHTHTHFCKIAPLDGREWWIHGPQPLLDGRQRRSKRPLLPCQQPIWCVSLSLSLSFCVSLSLSLCLLVSVCQLDGRQRRSKRPSLPCQQPIWCVSLSLSLSLCVSLSLCL
jgi:hypothetical protein